MIPDSVMRGLRPTAVRLKFLCRDDESDLFQTRFQIVIPGPAAGRDPGIHVARTK